MPPGEANRVLLVSAHQGYCMATYFGPRWPPARHFQRHPSVSLPTGLLETKLPRRPDCVIEAWRLFSQSCFFYFYLMCSQARRVRGSLRAAYLPLASFAVRKKMSCCWTFVRKTPQDCSPSPPELKN